MRDYRMLIGGEWVEAASGETFETVNPFTGRAWATVPRAGAADVDAAVRAAQGALPDSPRRRAGGGRGARPAGVGAAPAGGARPAAAAARRADRRARVAHRRGRDDGQ